MTNQQMMNESYTDLTETLYDLTQAINQADDWVVLEDYLDLANTISTILKRMGETAVLEKVNDELIPAKTEDIDELVKEKKTKTKKAIRKVGETA